MWITQDKSGWSRMTRRLRMKHFALYLLVFFSLVGGRSAGAAAVGRIEKLDGQARIHRGEVVIPVGTGLELHAEDEVFTDKWSSTGIVLQDGTVLFLGPDSRLLIRDFLPAPSDSAGTSAVRLLKGFLSFIAGLVPEKARTETPDAVIAILIDPSPDEEQHVKGNTGRPADAGDWRGHPCGPERAVP